MWHAFRVLGGIVIRRRQLASQRDGVLLYIYFSMVADTRCWEDEG